MSVTLPEGARAGLARQLQTMFATEFDEELSGFQAEQVVDMMVRTMGAEIYNQALKDVRAFFQARVDDLEGELFVDGGT